MKQKLLSALLALSLMACQPLQGNKGAQYTLSRDDAPVHITIDQEAGELIAWAAEDFAANLELMLGYEVEVKRGESAADDRGIYIGQFDGNLMQAIVADQKAALEGQWEKFSVQKCGEQLIIAGSDARGTVYGVFEVAERMGISPWDWWADVKPMAQSEVGLSLPEGGIVSAPSVQYRGIFLNDEDWGLQPWAEHTFETEVGDIGPKTYEKIFQLLLKLKANTIWPAMHPSTKAFYQIPGNHEMAERYGIFVGTSHAEPMLRNNVDEWDHAVRGEYNYFSNSSQVQDYWDERVAEAVNTPAIYTMGMRGVHDSSMEGASSLQDQVGMVETIIADQRAMLERHSGKTAEELPQVLIPYKEVLKIYNAGLEVPEDITLMWTDDNFGYIRRHSNAEERKRLGGGGVYYHLSYWGKPHDYLWLSTTQPSLIWWEMKRAYQNGAQKMWIANVGDIKPAEYNMEFFLDLAWDINSISEDNIQKHLEDWCARKFGEKNAKKIAALKQEYYRLAFLRKPELMGWTGVEPQTAVQATEFSMANGNELQRRIDDYTALYNKAETLRAKLPEERLSAYFQLVEYPVKGAALMNHKFLHAQRSRYAGSTEKQKEAQEQAQAAYDEIAALTHHYNKVNEGGKWDRMMSMQPRGLAVFHMPNYHLKQDVDSNPGLKMAAKARAPRPIFINADEYSAKSEMGDYEWTSVEGLGYSGSAMSIIPMTEHYFETDEAALEYEFKATKGKYEMELRFLPTHANEFDHSVALSINGSDLGSHDINTVGRSEDWKINAARNFVAVKVPVNLTEDGMQVLKVGVNQTGMVLDQIAINPEGCERYYEIRR